MKVSKDFDIREFVPKIIWDRYKNQSVWFVNSAIIQLAQAYKDMASVKWNKQIFIRINDWMYGGGRHWSGLRTVDYINKQVKSGVKTATLSQHIGGMCNAFDCQPYYKDETGKPVMINCDEFRKFIIGNESFFMKIGLTTLESGQHAPTWVHSDCRPTGLKGILMVGA